jgi:IMP dehydrogenase
MGVVHRNLSIEDQVTEVDKVKRSESGMIVDPVTLGPDELVGAALDLMAKYKISGVPIIDGDRRWSASSPTATCASTTTRTTASAR